MHAKAGQRFEDGLEAIARGIKSKGGTKKRDKVNERLGRLKERCSTVQGDYEIAFTYDDRDTATSLSWAKKEEKSLVRTAGEGKYIVQTSLSGHSEEQI